MCPAINIYTDYDMRMDLCRFLCKADNCELELVSNVPLYAARFL